MATTTFSSSQVLTNDADFQAFVANIHAALAAIGLVQTADTGQINPATVLKPTVVGTSAGYEIWRFNDALQATKPVFIKMEYGVPNSVSSVSTWITVGTGTNGAGTLTGQVSTRAQIAATNNSATAATSYFSGNTSRLTSAIMVTPGVGTVNMSHNVERSKDATGADNGEGIIISCVSSLNSGFFQWVPFTGTVPTSQVWPVIMPNTTTAVEGANVGMFPVQPNPIGPLKPPARGQLVYCNADIAAPSDQTVPMYGANHTYKATGVTNAGLSRLSQSFAALAILWE